jgi:exopolysaccharide production protein ExoQ
MMASIATLATVLIIAGLFAMERDRSVRISKALWIPTAWVLIAASRMVSQWWNADPQIPTSSLYLDGSPLDRFIFTALLMAGIVVLLIRGRRTMAIVRMNVPILLFFSYCAVSILWSDYPDVAFRRWVKALGDLVMVLIILTERDRSGAIKRLLSRVGFFLIPLSVLLIKYYPHIGQAYSIENGAIINTGVTLNKNQLGSLCLIVGLASLWRLTSTFREPFHRTSQLIAHGIILAMVLWLLFAANSATSLACFLLGSALIIFMALPGKRRPARLHLIVGAVACVGLLVLVMPDAFGSVVQVLGRNTTLTGRTQIWHLLLNMGTNPWIGTGFMSFWLGNRLDKVWSLLYGYVEEAHNGYLEIYLNLGWIGIGFLVLLLVRGYSNVVAFYRRDVEGGSLRLTLFIVALAYNITEAAFRTLFPIWIFLLFAIAAVPEVHSRNGWDAAKRADPSVREDSLLGARITNDEEII